MTNSKTVNAFPSNKSNLNELRMEESEININK